MLGQAARQKITCILQTNSGQDVLTLGAVGKDFPGELPAECPGPCSAELKEEQALERDHLVADRVVGRSGCDLANMVTVVCVKKTEEG